MMKITIEGIVLNETNYSETSKILNILTKEYGLISVISKGSRSLKSHLRGISMKLVYASFTISYKEKGLSTLIEGSPINSLKYIMTNFKKMGYANYLIELTKNVLKENNQGEIFEELIPCLIKINEDFDPEIITNIYEVKMLKYLGVNPSFSKCISCGDSDVLTFDVNLGGVVCKNCYQNTYLFQPNTLKLLKLFQNIQIANIDKLNISSKKVRQELNLFIKEYYDTYTGIYMPRKDNLEKLTLIK